MPFIVFDGMDGAGKSTQMGLLHDYLVSNNYQVRSFHQPSHTRIGRIIRDQVLSSGSRFSPLGEAFLYGADQIDLIATTLDELTDQNVWILMHRWIPSQIVYQGLTDGAPLDDVIQLCRLASVSTTHPDMEVIPDYSFIFVADPDKAYERVSTRVGGIQGPYEKYENLQISFNGFTDLCAADSQLGRKLFWMGPTRLFDTTEGDPAVIHRSILEQLRDANLLQP